MRFFPFGAVVTANTFDYLGVPPLLGRAISLDDGRPGAPPVFVMNYRLWQREFGGDPKILGTTFILNGKPTTLVGIMPLQFNAFNANFWLPVTPNYGWLQMAGRLKPGVHVALPEPTSIPLRTVCTSQTQVEFFRRISSRSRRRRCSTVLSETFGKHFMHC